MTTGTGIHFAKTTLGLAACLVAFSASPTFSATPPANEKLADAAIGVETATVLEIVAPVGEGALGTIRFGTRGKTNHTGLPFGGPR